MSQHDGVLDNGPGLAVRTDMNAALQALMTLNSGPVEPTTMYSGMLWLDTTVAPDGLLRQRNQANTGWITPQTGAVGPPISNIVTTVVTSSGTYTKPTGLKFLEIELVAPGGGGGYGGGGTSTSAAGAGGGAGGYARKLIPAASLGATETMTVGVPGAGGIAASSTPAGNAGSTSFGAHCSATGGQGGSAMNGGTTVVVIGGTVGGTGTGGVGSGGDINISGGDGGLAFRTSGTFAVPGNGGNSFFGAGLKGAYDTSGPSAIDPTRAGAGGGGASSFSATGRNGGIGGPSAIILREIF